MPETINRVEVQGVVANAEMKYTPNGAAILNLRVKLEEEFQRRDKSTGTRTTTIFVTAWGKLAQDFEGVKVGSWINVKGRWTVDSWEKNGKKNYFNKLTAMKIEMVGGDAVGQATVESSQVATGATPQEAQENLQSATGKGEEDVPF